MDRLTSGCGDGGGKSSRRVKPIPAAHRNWLWRLLELKLQKLDKIVARSLKYTLQMMQLRLTESIRRYCIIPVPFHEIL